MGRKTRKPNSEVVVMVATMPPSPTLGCLHTIDTPVKRTRSGFSPVVESGVLPCFSVTPKSTIMPPMATSATETQSVLYPPIKRQGKACQQRA